MVKLKFLTTFILAAIFVLSVNSPAFAKQLEVINRSGQTITEIYVKVSNQRNWYWIIVNKVDRKKRKNFQWLSKKADSKSSGERKLLFE